MALGLSMPPIQTTSLPIDCYDIGIGGATGMSLSGPDRSIILMIGRSSCREIVDVLQGVKQPTPRIGQPVFDPRRLLCVIHPFHQSVLDEIPKMLGEHLLRDARRAASSIARRKIAINPSMNGYPLRCPAFPRAPSIVPSRRFNRTSLRSQPRSFRFHTTPYIPAPNTLRVSDNEFPPILHDQVAFTTPYALRVTASTAKDARAKSRFRASGIL
ncbi:hypothetical protein SAMN05443573_11490 [Celeribacter indicus]|nr:hypothetical protein SAMN05443573_11490 [Celeribacter indicus]